MPVWDKAFFESQYTGNGWPYGIRGKTYVPRFHYNWFNVRLSAAAYVSRYLELPGFAQLSDVAIIGGGYGWTCEALAAHGINAISIDTSDHIINTYNTSEEAELREYLTARGFDPDLGDGVVYMSPDDPNSPCNPWDFWLRPDGVRTSVAILDEDLSTNGSRRNVRQALSSNMDAIVTEYAIDSMDAGDDAASLALVERCEQLRPNPACTVIHVIGENPDDVILNVKSPAEWRALLDANGYTDHVVMDMLGTVLTAGG